jgi:hypothetical protein
MSKSQIFPTILLTLDICAAIPYFVDGNWRKGAYWCFAAGLTWTVTF